MSDTATNATHFCNKCGWVGNGGPLHAGCPYFAAPVSQATPSFTDHEIEDLVLLVSGAAACAAYTRSKARRPDLDKLEEIDTERRAAMREIIERFVRLRRAYATAADELLAARMDESEAERKLVVVSASFRTVSNMLSAAAAPLERSLKTKRPSDESVSVDADQLIHLLSAIRHTDALSREVGR